MSDEASGLIAGRSERRSRRREGPLRVLLLAGTGEARHIAYALARDSRVSSTAALARAGRRPMPLGVPARIGGWGGREAFRDWVVEKRFNGIIDATHPFAAAISHRTASVAEELGIDYLQFLRPSWRPEGGDEWVFLHKEEDAAAHIPQGARVFLATGRKRLDAFSNLTSRDLVCRILDAPGGPFPLPNGRFVVHRPPFTVEDEMATLERLGIDWLVARNSGGSGSRAKIDAAGRLGLPVAMIRRPPQPEAARAETLSEVLAWVGRRA
ncbi:MAG: cobalt-precorrin-6A reductase [Paracoccaceae bacterium]|nr:cobalt-precorrin-6A reductase [Paracoccaceae bacterium]